MTVCGERVIPLPRRRSLKSGRIPRILIVNDSPDTRDLLTRNLKQAGYSHIKEAGDGRAAIRQLKLSKVDVLITDIHMPHLDGWRLARMVRSGLFSSASTIPIIAVSATYSERLAESSAREFGINRFLALPLARRQILADTVTELLEDSGQFVPKPSLLIIEDDPDTAVLASRMLRHRFQVEVVTDGRTGLTRWREGNYDLVLLDVMLPKLAGPEVLNEMLKLKPRQAVVIMTADGTAERCEELMLDGAVDFIAKPFHANQLREICEMALRRDDWLTNNEEFSQRGHALRTVQENYQKIADAHQRLLDNLGAVVFELDTKGRLRFLNLAWEQLSQHKVRDTLGRPLHEFLHTEDRRHYRSVMKSLAEGRTLHHKQELRLQNKQGEVLWAEITLDCRQHPVHGVEAIVGHLTDITERKRAMEQVEHMAMHDSLTGLYNRRYFEMSLEHTLASGARSGAPHALLYIDLDHFQMLNDTLGHREGDLILKEVSELLAARTRSADTLCRLGGDEFALLLTHTDRPQAIAVAEAIIKAINDHTFSSGDTSLTLGCSIGVSLLDGGQAGAAEHLVRADKASFVAKNRGRNLVHVYNPADRDSEELRHTVDWAHRVRQAIAEQQLELHIQPIVDTVSRAVHHYEALLRLHSPGHQELVTPATFIPAVEKAGQIHALDRWVINRAMEHLATHRWIHCLAINLSGRAFEDPDLIHYIQATLKHHRLEPQRVIFEITETASVANITETQRMIRRLRKVGCRFALDDFGTGYCSYQYLRQLPTDYLKLDGSYIRNIAHNDLDLTMVRSMNEIAHILGKKTIAECVESNAVMEHLRNIGVDYVQGNNTGGVAPINEYRAAHPRISPA
ncbi:MAG TPA: EAL domain-containing protein [Gammaproteobacteria bacterium]|nr:EAL domain-containing protein [Gammaproteobacteria bacterium]